VPAIRPELAERWPAATCEEIAQRALVNMVLASELATCPVREECEPDRSQSRRRPFQSPRADSNQALWLADPRRWLDSALGRLGTTLDVLRRRTRPLGLLADSLSVSSRRSKPGAVGRFKGVLGRFETPKRPGLPVDIP
jgi:hypothetical protein